MRLKIYRAATVSAAMAQARNDLGPDALILSTRRTSAGVELTAALEPQTDAPPPPPLPLPAPATLTWHGIPDRLAARLAAGPLTATLPTLLRFGALPLGAEAPPLLLTGPPGAGKTLTTARLATRLVLAGAAPLIITADGRRAGAAEELAAYTRLLGLNLVVASTQATLARALQHRDPNAAVLIDTAGVNPFDPVAMAAIQALATTAAATQALVLPAGKDIVEAAEQAAAFATQGARYLIATKLDIARRLGSVISAAIAGNLALAEAGIGPSATDGLTPLTAALLAARLAETPLSQQANQAHARPSA